MAVEEIPGITFAFEGEELPEWMAIQRLYRGGFTDPRILLVMFAIIEGESGSFLQAWHMNVERNPEGGIVRYGIENELQHMRVKSIDLGFCQFNVVVPPNTFLEMTQEEVSLFVADKFEENPRLIQADTSSEDAFEMHSRRGFTPWMAYKPGTPEFKLKKRRACKALANWLCRTQVGRMPIDDNYYPHLDFDSEVKV